jgi:hypothetical protein
MNALDGHWLSSVLTPPMEALAILWFTKYLLLFAHKKSPETLLQSEVAKFATNYPVVGSDPLVWPVTAWSDKGSRKTYSDLDYKFFFSTRDAIVECCRADDAKPANERFLYFDFQEQLKEAFATVDVQGADSQSTSSEDASSSFAASESLPNTMLVEPCAYVCPTPDNRAAV